MLKQMHLDAIDTLHKIEALAIAAGYLTEGNESEMQLELLNRIGIIARRVIKPESREKGE